MKLDFDFHGTLMFGLLRGHLSLQAAARHEHDTVVSNTPADPAPDNRGHVDQDEALFVVLGDVDREKRGRSDGRRIVRRDVRPRVSP